MTSPRYLRGCAAESKACGTALGSPGDYAWIVNFNNGNSNWNNQDNDNYVRAVRASEYQNAPSFRDLHTAWREARRGKKPSPNQLTFDAYWMDGLLALQQQLREGIWRPKPTTCFVASAPKAREIHAPDFSDRIVHHWLVPQLETIYDRAFIFDSYSNRRGKGTHAALGRLRSFVRQVTDGQGGGWYLQLDIANCFNTVHRPTLYGMLKGRMERYGLPLASRQATHSLLARSPTDQGVHYACTAAERRSVPAHKRLENAAPGCGIPIGNLSSQFFANVYLDALDQFIKHELRAQRYIRYVDDFVLVHESREQLEQWRAQIAQFLEERLRLKLKAHSEPRPLDTGIDFLGYVTFPTRTVVRRRVAGHCIEKLAGWERLHVRQGRIHASRPDLELLRSTWSSYSGHFSHANSYRLRERIHRRYPWLRNGAEALAP